MGRETVKTRSLALLSGVFHHEFGTVANNYYSLINDDKYSITGNQYTRSRSHPEYFILRDYHDRLLERYARTGDDWYRRRALLIKGLDVGGGFYSAIRTAELNSRYVSCSGVRGRTGTSIHRYWGNLLPSVTLSNMDYKSIRWPVPPAETFVMNDLVGKGATAIARTIPTAPMVSVANFAGELRRDGIPNLIGSVLFRAKTFKQFLRGAGEEYLNYEFGWRPFVSDLTSLLGAVQRSRQIIEQFERDSGRLINRHYSFPLQRAVTLSDKGLTSLYPTINTFAYNGSTTGRYTVESTVESNYWFEGTYSYHLPTGDSARAKVFKYAAEADKLLGIRITPEVLWNLAPWTWLADWFVNSSSIATNLSAFSQDGLLLKRGYIMCTYSAVDVHTNSGVDLIGFGATGPSTLTLKSIVKSRRRATPWGFGVTFSEFTPKQIAILSALGITRDLTWK